MRSRRSQRIRQGHEEEQRIRRDHEEDRTLFEDFLGHEDTPRRHEEEEELWLART
jgi:hypothetical protein